MNSFQIKDQFTKEEIERIKFILKTFKGKIVMLQKRGENEKTKNNNEL